MVVELCAPWANSMIAFRHVHHISGCCCSGVLGTALYNTQQLVAPSALLSLSMATCRAWHRVNAALRRRAASVARRAAGAAAVARSAARPEALAAGGVRGRAALHHRRLRARRRRIPWQRGAAAKSVRGGSAHRASPLALVATARRWRREGAVGCAAPSAPLRARSRWCEAAPRDQLLCSVATAIFFPGGSGCRRVCESRRLAEALLSAARALARDAVRAGGSARRWRLACGWPRFL